jgi:hypothetical protein
LHHLGSKASNSELQIASLVSKNTLEVLLGSNKTHCDISQDLRHANQGIHPQLYAIYGLFNKGATSYMGPKAILRRYVQSQIHSLKEAIR